MTEARSHFVAVIPQFAVPDLVRTSEYYRDVLGFQINSYWDGERATPEPHDTATFAIVSRDPSRPGLPREATTRLPTSYAALAPTSLMAPTTACTVNANWSSATDALSERAG